MICIGDAGFNQVSGKVREFLFFVTAEEFGWHVAFRMSEAEAWEFASAARESQTLAGSGGCGGNNQRTLSIRRSRFLWRSTDGGQIAFLRQLPQNSSKPTLRDNEFSSLFTPRQGQIPSESCQVLVLVLNHIKRT